MSFLSSFALSIAVILLLHAAYSLQHYRSLVHDMAEVVEGSVASSTAITTIGIPVDIRVELGLAFGMLLLQELFRVVLAPVVESANAKKSKGFPPAYVTRDFDMYKDRARGFAASKKAI